MDEVVTMTLETLISNISTFFTGAIGWLEDLVTAVGSQPLLLLFVAIVPLSGYAVGFFKRLIHAN